MFKLTIKTDNAAFCDDDGAEDQTAAAHEVMRILERIAGRLENGATSGTCVDANGNSVGRWELVP